MWRKHGAFDSPPEHCWENENPDDLTLKPTVPWRMEHLLSITYFLHIFSSRKKTLHLKQMFTFQDYHIHLLLQYHKVLSFGPLHIQSWKILLNPICVVSHFNCVQLFATLWTVAHQAPLSMGFCRQKYWSGLSCPCQLQEIFLTQGLNPPLISPALAVRFFTTSANWEAQILFDHQILMWKMCPNDAFKFSICNFCC